MTQSLYLTLTVIAVVIEAVFTPFFLHYQRLSEYLQDAEKTAKFNFRLNLNSFYCWLSSA